MSNGMTPMGQAAPSTLMSRAGAPPMRRFGRIAARIGTDHIHTCHIETKITQKSVMAANDPSETRFDLRLRAAPGIRVQLAIHDITLFPDLAQHAKWYCQHPHCQLLKKSWHSKEELLAAHEDDRILIQKEETHVYYAAVEIPETAGQDEVKDEKGKITQRGRERQAPVVMLLSDES